jgi:hypothetical protein
MPGAGRTSGPMARRIRRSSQLLVPRPHPCAPRSPAGTARPSRRPVRQHARTFRGPPAPSSSATNFPTILPDSHHGLWLTLNAARQAISADLHCCRLGGHGGRYCDRKVVMSLAGLNLTANSVRCHAKTATCCLRDWVTSGVAVSHGCGPFPGIRIEISDVLAARSRNSPSAPRALWPSPCLLAWSTLRDGGRSIGVPLVPEGRSAWSTPAGRRPDASGAVLPATASITWALRVGRRGMVGSPPGAAA